LRGYFRDDGEEGGALDVAGGAQTGSDGVEVLVVVTGMAAQFEDAFGGKSVEGFGEGLGCEVAGGGDGEGSIGGEDVAVAQLVEAVKRRLHAVEEVDFQAAKKAAVAEGAGPCGFERIADGADGGAFGEIKEGTGDGGEEMGVLVGVEMGDVDAGALELLKLGESFSLDVVLADFAAEERLGEVDEAGAEGLAVSADEGGDALRVGDGYAVDEGDVAAYAEGGVGARDGDGVIKRRAVGHECGRGEGAGLMKLGDGSVDARGEAEVVRVEDETGRHGGCLYFGPGANVGARSMTDLIVPASPTR
jgi:hypothetical protein